jgi:hypothetical protein
VTLLSAWVLGGLVLAVPLVLVHLRRNRPQTWDVASLLAWRELPGQDASPSRRLGRPLLPLLLALQLLALVLLVLSLARPASGAGTPRPRHIYVVDDSVWMQAQQAGGTRMAAARHLLRGQLQALPASAQVRLLSAGATPSLVFSGSAHSAVRALSKLRAGDGPADLQTALNLAVGLRATRVDRIELLHAPEDAAPVVSAPPSSYAQVVVGDPLDDQGLFDATARCGLPATSGSPCEVFARVLNTAASVRTERVLALEHGRAVSAQTVTIAAGSSSPVAFRAPAGAAVQLQLVGHDALTADDDAFVAVPVSSSVRITLVGSPSHALALARALASVPDVELRLRTSASYRATDSSTSDLLVLDGWLPPGALPDAPSLLLVNPPRVPGGHVQGTLSDSRLSGFDSSSPLLEGVDLSALTVFGGQARNMTLPHWMAAVAWTPEGPLLAAGSLGGQRVELLAFDPSGSDLPQLASFPVLVANLVELSQQWAPSQVAAGQHVSVLEPPSTTSATLTESSGVTHPLTLGTSAPHTLLLAHPGLVAITQRGPWGTRSQTIAVNVQSSAVAAPSTPIDLNATPTADRAPPRPWWPWVLAAAILTLLMAFTYEVLRAPRMASV